MFGLKTKSDFKPEKIEKAADKAAFKNVGHAAASIRKTSRASIKRAPKEQRSGSKSRGGKKVRRASHRASPAGTPPHTQKGQLPNAIVYFVEKDGSYAVIGPRKSVVGEAGAAHEFGGMFRSADYPPRPFMFPALEEAAPRFAGSFSGSIGE